MMIFWILVTLLILVVLAVLAWPLLRDPSVAGAGDDGRLNLAVYRQQLRELEADHERGLVTEEQMEQARLDIERALLREVPEQPAARTAGHGIGRLWPVMLVSAAVVAVSVPVYMHIGYPQNIDSPPAAAGNGNIPSLDEMIARLEQRLEHEPDDTQGWLMLARSYSALGRHRKAAGALERLRERIGDEPTLLVRLANSLAMANEGRFEGRPAELIRRVLRQDPENPSAIWFGGLAASQRGDYREAIDYWQRLEPKLDGEPEALERLREMIAGARNAMREEGTAAPPDGDEADSPGLTVRVSLAADLEDLASDDDTLYVFARAADGPAMPLAVVRRRAGDLPLEVRLDDTQAMTPATRLSGHETVTLVARISRSDSAQAESGDLQGEITDVSVPADAPVDLIIDAPVP